MTTFSLPRSVVLLSSGPPISLKVLYCLQRLGVIVDIVDIGIPSIARHSRYRRHYMRIPVSSSDMTNPEMDFANALQAYIHEQGVQGVIGGDIASTGLLHEIREQLIGVTVFPTSDRDTLELLDDKWRFQEFMVGHGIPCPKAVLLESMDHVHSLAQSVGFPLVVKPLFGESGHGIVRIEDSQALAAHLESGSKYATLPLILQEFAPGGDADISVLAFEGRVVCHVIHAREAGCTLRFMENREVLDVAERIISAARYTGVANIDIRLDERTGSVFVLECNPRFWYTLQASLWRGLNFVEAGFRLAAGEDVVLPAPTHGAYHLHGCLLTRLLWNPAKWRSIEGYNLRGLLQALSDPLPFLCSHR